jgi:hypothetical protein
MTTPAPSIPNFAELIGGLKRLRLLQTNVLDGELLHEAAKALEESVRSQSEARARVLEEAAKVATCSSPNDGRNHSECPFCEIAVAIRARASGTPQKVTP